MSSCNNSFCRLCASLKPREELTDLQQNDEHSREFFIKCNRLNISYIDYSSSDDLPKTVCFTCFSSLDKAYEFVINVEQAQIVLNDLVLERKIKKEGSVSEPNSDNEFYEIDFRLPVDVNNVVVKKESDDIRSKLELSLKKQRKQKKNIKDLDTLPLAQLKQTWRDYSWTCSVCETQFCNIEELKSHSIQYHETCNAFRCVDCNIRKLKLDNFLLHVKSHRKYLKFSCYLCMERFATVHECKVHISIHNTTEYVCPGCNSNFSNCDDLNKHKNIFYKLKKVRQIPGISELADRLSCILCQKSFKNKSSLHTHLLTHTNRPRDHTCDKCGKCFYKKQNLADHMMLHDNTRPHKCEICKFGFKTPQQLRNHVGVHDGQKPFSCDQCGKCFRLHQQLKSHHIIHTDALPHVCSYCNKSFRFKTILNQHIRQHTGLKPYSCEICQRDFTNWSNYNKHMRRRHSIETAKKKHTPDGVYPIDPATGEIIVFKESDNIEEWKRKMMAQRRPGRPKQRQEDIRSNDAQAD